jgi:N utilization substance protein A
MEVVVADDQLSLAIGKKGQNVRLASKLTGWKIDIKSESRMEKISSEILEKFKDLPHIGDVASRILYNEGFRSIKEVAEVDPEELAKVLGFEKEKAGEVVAAAVQLSQKEGEAIVGQAAVPTGADLTVDPVAQMEGVGEKTAQLLEENGFKTIQDILKTNAETLSSLPGIGVKKAEKLIESAKQYVEGKKA